MTERPIIMSGDSVRLILQGKKTQTRRVVLPQPRNHLTEVHSADPEGFWFTPADGQPGATDPKAWQLALPPYGKAGDKLWVREHYMLRARWDFDKPSEVPCGESDRVWYIADRSKDANGEYIAPPQSKWGVNRPALFMPRKFSRLTLEVKAVRVERLHDMTEADAITEGCAAEIYPSSYTPDGEVQDVDGYTALEDYSGWWDDLNAKRGYPWRDNPWVWVVEFELVAREKNG